MKYIIVFSLFIILIALSGCKQSTEPIDTNFYVNIEAESSFQNDPVQATLDSKVLLDSNITTNDVISLAWGSGLQELTKENHILSFSVTNFGSQKYYNINTQYDTTTVLIHFDRTTKEISFQQIKGIMFRD